jgi:hypothetical protein
VHSSLDEVDGAVAELQGFQEPLQGDCMTPHGGRPKTAVSAAQNPGTGDLARRGFEGAALLRDKCWEKRASRQKKEQSHLTLGGVTAYILASTEALCGQLDSNR